MSWNRHLIAGVSAAGLLVALGGAAQAQSSAHSQAQPQAAKPVHKGALTFDEENLNLGVVHDGGKIDVSFPFTNTSEMPIMIIKVKPSCGCTVADEYDDAVIQPGESTELKVKFNPAGKVGRSSVTIRVETDDPERPTVNLMLAAEVEPIVQADPSIIQFGDLRKGEEKSITARISGEMEEFKVLFATASDSDIIDVEVVEHSREIVKPKFQLMGEDGTVEEDEGHARDGTTLKVTFRGRDKIGAFSESMLGRTNDDRRKLIPINVLGRIVGDVHIVPERIGLGLLKPGEPFSKELHVSSRSGAQFEILEAYADLDIPDDFDIEIRPSATEDGSSAYTLILSGTTSTDHTQRRPIRGELVIKTNVPGEQELSVNTFGSIRPTPTPRTPPK